MSFLLSLLFLCSLHADTSRNILILHEGNANHPANIFVAGIFRQVLGLDQRNQVFEEYIDEDRLDASDERLETALREKYRGRKMDLVIGDGRPALNFLIERVAKLWPGSSKIFYFVEARELPLKLPPNMTGVAMNVDYGATLDLALQLRPNTRHAFYIGGVNAWETEWRSLASQDFKRFDGRVEVTYLNDLPLAQMLDRLGRLPDDSVVIYSELLRDASGHVYVPGRVCSIIASAANVPVFGPFDSYLGCGILGGSIVEMSDIAHQTAQLGLRVLERGTASGFPIETSRRAVVLDWRQMERWAIDEKSVPSDAIVKFRPPSLWGEYGKYLSASVAAIALQLSLIVGLVAEMRRRKRSESANKSLTGRLITAAEDERQRIARELHDDIGQRLSLISLNLNMIGASSSEKDGDSNLGLQDPLRDLDELITDVHNLSHQLHSSKLQVLGLKAALNEVCERLARQHGLQIQLLAENVPERLPDDIALCFYRVAQEAVNNAVKYSNASRIDLDIAAKNNILTMTIKDDGTGFDTSTASNGLGLATMRERLRLVGGELSVTSKIGAGTVVTAQLKCHLPAYEASAA